MNHTQTLNKQESPGFSRGHPAVSRGQEQSALEDTNYAAVSSAICVSEKTQKPRIHFDTKRFGRGFEDRGSPRLGLMWGSQDQREGTTWSAERQQESTGSFLDHEKG